MNRKFMHSIKKNKNCKIKEDTLVESLAVMAKLCGENFIEIDHTLEIERDTEILLSKNKLTNKNHLLFINGCCKIINISYKIEDNYFINLFGTLSEGDNVLLFFK